MKRTTYRLLSWILWLAVPATVARVVTVWDRLPARVAVHFDLSGHPNGWMSPSELLVFLLILLGLSLATTMFAAYRVSVPDHSAWTLLGFFYVIAGILYGAADAIVRYNLYGRGVNPAPFLVAGFGSAFVLAVVYLGTRRGPPLPGAKVIADEVHGSRLWALIMTLPCALLVALAVLAPSLVVRLLLIAPTLLMLMAAIMAGSGFHYIFSASGLEIRTLGFRLRTIPAAQIRDYAVDSWSAAGGYGIRGVGNTRAYVWGKRGVRIHTWNGEVFLGHRDPEQLVRDLDAIMSFAH